MRHSRGLQAGGGQGNAPLFTAAGVDSAPNTLRLPHSLLAPSHQALNSLQVRDCRAFVHSSGVTPDDLGHVQPGRVVIHNLPHGCQQQRRQRLAPLWAALARLPRSFDSSVRIDTTLPFAILCIAGRCSSACSPLSWPARLRLGSNIRHGLYGSIATARQLVAWAVSALGPEARALAEPAASRVCRRWKSARCTDQHSPPRCFVQTSLRFICRT